MIAKCLKIGPKHLMKSQRSSSYRISLMSYECSYEGLMNVRKFFLAHLVKFNGLEDVFNFGGTVIFSIFLIFEAL